MSDLPRPLRVSTRFGPLFIAVHPADEHSCHDVDRGSVMELRPAVRLGSDPGFTADPRADDHWTIRGRDYAVHCHMTFKDITSPNAKNGKRWHLTHHEYEGFRNDRRAEVPFLSATHRAMIQALEEALDAFADAYPDWTDLSIYLHHRTRQRHHEREVAMLRQAAFEETTYAAACATDAETIAATLTAKTLTLMSPDHP